MKKILYLLSFLILFLPSIASAEIIFNPHLVLTDEEMTNYQSMTLVEIEKFLAKKNSGLTRLYIPDADNNASQASMIIWKAAQDYKINPQVLLTTLQKEQSLIETPAPSVNQLNKAMGYRCPDGGSCHPNAATFGKQVDGAAWQFREYMDRPERWNIVARGSYFIDEFLISPLTQATAALYNYTPHYSGNKSFWSIWMKYWGKNFPEGSVVKASGDPAVWLIQNGTRRPIVSYGVFLSRFDPKKILTVTASDLEKYEIGAPIKFHNYSLLHKPTGEIYLLVDDSLRHITSMEVFRTIGFNPEELITVSEQDVAGYEIGEPITLETVYPSGALLQDKNTGGVFFVQDGVKHPIFSKEIMTTNFRNRVLTSVNAQQLEKYPLGDPIYFANGELVKSKNGNKIYVISNGQKHWIASEEAFAKFGYRWDNVIETTDEMLSFHQDGEIIE